MADSHRDTGIEQASMRSLGVAIPAPTKDVAPNLALPWVLRLRYGIVAGEAAIILCMAYVFHVKFPVLWTLAPLIAILGSNIALGRSYIVSTSFPEKTLGAIFALDTLCLTITLGLTGGPMNPFSLLYLVQITLSAVALNKLWTWALGVLSTACFGLLFWLHAPLPILEKHHTEQGLSPHLLGMWIAFMIAAALIILYRESFGRASTSRAGSAGLEGSGGEARAPGFSGHIGGGRSARVGNAFRNDRDRREGA